jgi:hypothetical protein
VSGGRQERWLWRLARLVAVEACGIHAEGLWCGKGTSAFRVNVTLLLRWWLRYMDGTALLIFLYEVDDVRSLNLRAQGFFGGWLRYDARCRFALNHLSSPVFGR